MLWLVPVIPKSLYVNAEVYGSTDSETSAASLGIAFGIFLQQELHLLVHETNSTEPEAVYPPVIRIEKRFDLLARGMIEVEGKADLLLCEGNQFEEESVSLEVRAF